MQVSERASGRDIRGSCSSAKRPPPPFSFRPPGASDHYTHVVEGAYDWHAMDQPNFDAAGRYAGNLVRDDALAFIEKVSGSANTQPFFL